MSKVIRLTESDIENVVRGVIKQKKNTRIKIRQYFNDGN